MLFPDLYVPQEEAKLSQEQLAFLYNQVIRPSVALVQPDALAHWPISYNAAFQLSLDRNGHRHDHSIDIPEDCLEQFAHSIQTRLAVSEGHLLGHRTIFQVEFRGTKGGFNFDWFDTDERQEMLNKFVEPIDFMDQESENLDQWYVDVGMELSVPDHVVQWATDHHATILRYAHRTMDENRADRAVESRYYSRDVSAHIFSLSGFRYAPEVSRDGIFYVNAYTTDKEATYQLHNGMFRARSADQLLPKKIGRLVAEVNRVAEVFAECAGADGTSQDGTARLEVRTRLENAMTCMDVFPDHILRSVILAVPNNVWWSVNSNCSSPRPRAVTNFTFDSGRGSTTVQLRLATSCAASFVTALMLAFSRPPSPSARQLSTCSTPFPPVRTIARRSSL